MVRQLHHNSTDQPIKESTNQPFNESIKYPWHSSVTLSGRKTANMKTTRLLAYAAAGIIGGLLIENASLIWKQKAEKTARKLKTKVKKAVAAS